MRTIKLVQALGSSAVLLAFVGAAALADDITVGEQVVNVMNKLYGSHPGFRANHAKGIVVEGSFTPTPAAAALSKASVFQGSPVPVPVTVRFSNSTGLPAVPDGSDLANPHGMSIKFYLADGTDMDVVTNALKFFPVSTGEDFRDLLQAFSDTGPDSPKPTKADQFIARHPTVPAAFATVSTPTSFARENYYGIDAFVFVDQAARRQPFRFQLLPLAGAEHLTKADAASKAPDFLMEELPARLAKEPVKFRVVAQLANPGDQTKDPAQPWPDDRRTVDLGTITLTAAVADSASAQKALLYLPNNVPDGIEPSDDPLIDTRVQAYAVSFGRRSQ